MKVRAWLIVAASLSLLLTGLGIAGCGDKAATPARPIQFTDDLGRQLSVEKVPERIVSISPACTEILFALGLGDEVVGVTSYCNYPEEATTKPQIGDFTNPNVEAIVAQSPDLVLATGGLQTEMLDRMESLGLTVYAVNPTTFADTVAGIRKIGQLTGAQAKAEGIASDMEKRAAVITSAVDKARQEGKARPRVFFEIFYENGVWTAGSSSIISDLIQTAGGINLSDAEQSDYYQFSVERLMVENPDVYFVGSGSMSNPGDITARPGWDRLNAVRDSRVYVLQDDLIYRTGPRLIEGLESIYAALSGQS